MKPLLAVLALVLLGLAALWALGRHGWDQVAEWSEPEEGYPAMLPQ